MTPEQLLSEAEKLKDMLITNRRELHLHPELGFDLEYTKDFVRSELEKMGYKPVECGKIRMWMLPIISKFAFRERAATAWC